MSYSYDRYETRRRQTSGSRTTWGHWIPLAITVTVATAGIAAWIWNERKDDNDDDDYLPKRSSKSEPSPGGQEGPLPPPAGYGQGPLPPEGYGPTTSQYPPMAPTSFGSVPPGQPPYTGAPGQRTVEEEGIVSRMSGALRRTPSPQQIIDGASRRVVAGVTAAGAVVGGALASITEEGKGDYEDHSRWSEEADSQNGSTKKREGSELRDTEAIAVSDQARAGSRVSGGRKTVAIVISAVTDHEYEEDAEYHQEHASILSHLPDHIDQASRVFVLIYDSNLKDNPSVTDSQNDQKTQSMASSFSDIRHEDAQSQGDGPGRSSPTQSKMFKTLYSQAKAIVDKETMIMPFSTPTGFVYMLRSLGPETVYLQATLAGSHGEYLDPIKSWVGQVVLVVGDESGHGGLVDSEDERGEDTQNKWWLDDPRIGLGKGIEVVEGLRIGEDWGRRIKGND